MEQDDEIDFCRRHIEKLIDIIFTNDEVIDSISGKWLQYKLTRNSGVTKTFEKLFSIILNEPIDVCVTSNLAAQNECVACLHIFGGKYPTLAIPYTCLNPDAIHCASVLIASNKHIFKDIQSNDLDKTLHFNHLTFDINVPDAKRFSMLKVICTCILKNIKEKCGARAFYECRDVITTVLSTLFVKKNDNCLQLGVSAHSFIRSLDVDSPHLERKK